MEELLKKVMKDKIKEQKEQNAKNIEEQKENVQKLLKDCKCMLCATDHGMAVTGSGSEVLAMFSAIAGSLNKSGLSEKMLIHAVKIGVETYSEDEEDDEEEIPTKDVLKEILTTLKEAIEETIEEDK